MIAATRGQTAVVFACSCGTVRIVRADKARRSLPCFGCKGWVRPAARFALGARGELPEDWRAQAGLTTEATR